MSIDRYARQTRFLGADAPASLAAARVAIVGCGALGGATAPLLARAGVGHLRLIDRDFIEPHNLQRQELFDEADLAADLPKAEAAARRLRRINSTIVVEAAVADLTPANADALLGGVALIIDGTDNFPVRYLINDWCVERGVPWIFAGCLGGAGQTLAVVPGRTPCLRCVLGEPPPAAATPTCETAGVLGPAVAAIGGFQAAEALKILLGQFDRLRPGLVHLDVWSNEFRGLRCAAPRADCPCCGARRFEWLREGRDAVETVRLCGRGSVQVRPATPLGLPWSEWPARLSPAGAVTANAYLLRFAAEGVRMTLFPDGRAIVEGTEDPARAKALYSRYFG